MATFSKRALRGKPISERIEHMRAAQKPRMVYVTPTNDDVRRLIKHPRGGGFGKDGGAEWPDDKFTHRRIADGDVTAAETPANGPDQNHANEPEPEHHGKRASSRGSSAGTT